MHIWIRHSARITRWFTTIWALALWMLVPLPGVAQDGSPQEVFMPKAERGAVVVVISGQTGTLRYRNYAKQVAELGYYTMLIDGKGHLDAGSGRGAEPALGDLEGAGLAKWCAR
jgi:hypothetical protein